MATKEITFHLVDASATEALGAALAACCPPGCILFLYGELGAGKSTLVRGFLHAAGHRGAVKSPTYTLVEEYALGGRHYYHFDLYRLGEPEELEYLGIRDYLDGQAICLIEWPQRGAGILPVPTLHLSLEYAGTSRVVRLQGEGGHAAELLACVSTHFSAG